MAHDVFISYSSEDKAVADAACATLEKRKIRCWVAPRDVPAGVPWASALIEAIRSSKIVVLILSEMSNGSTQVVREVDEAVGDGIPVLPLRIDDVEPSKQLRYYIKSVHWLDAVSPPMERHLEHLADSVDALLAVEEEQPSPAAGPVTPPREASPQKRPALPTWVTGVLAAAVVLILGGGVWLVAARTSGGDSAQQGATPSSSAPEGATSRNDLQWIHNPSTDHYYAKTESGMTWDNVDALAVQAGGHLVSLNDDAEALWFADVFGPNGVGSGPPRQDDGWYWIGLNRTTTGEIQWTSEEPLTFTQWCPGEPTETWQGSRSDLASVSLDDGCWIMQTRDFAGFPGVIEVEEEPN